LIGRGTYDPNSARTLLIGARNFAATVHLERPAAEQSFSHDAAAPLPLRATTQACEF
jgi:hypothetical protein